MKYGKEPLLRVVKRDNLTVRKKVIFYLIAIFTAIVSGGILLLILGVNPFQFFGDMITIGMVNNRFAYKNLEGLFKSFVPLLITSLALSLCFKMRFWNIGGEGQYIVGAITASAIALTFADKLPGILLLLIMAAAAMVAAGVYGAMTAVLKIKFGTNETLLTLMLNYIALYLLKFFGETKADWNIFLRTDSVRPVFATFPENAWMPVIKIGNFSLDISLIIGIVICFIIYTYLKKTKHGYEISVVGDSSSTAKFAGMSVDKIVVRTMFISAALIGLAGSFYVSTSHTLSPSVTNNAGWTGIIIAWLAKLNTAGIMIITLLISVLQFGCQIASSEFSSVDSHYAELLQGVILFLVLFADFLIKFKIIIRKKGE